MCSLPPIGAGEGGHEARHRRCSQSHIGAAMTTDEMIIRLFGIVDDKRVGIQRHPLDVLGELPILVIVAERRDFPTLWMVV